MKGIILGTFTGDFYSFVRDKELEYEMYPFRSFSKSIEPELLKIAEYVELIGKKKEVKEILFRLDNLYIPINNNVITLQELSIILNTPILFNKTTFYLNNVVVEKDKVKMAWRRVVSNNILFSEIIK